MSLVKSSTELKDYTGLSEKSAEKAYVFLPVAKKLMTLQIGIEKYDELDGLLPDDADAKVAAQAESFLALHYSLTPMSLRVADNGGLLRLVGHGDYQEELMSANMVAGMKKQIYAMAMEMIADFIPGLDDEDQAEKQYTGNGFGLTVV